MHLSLQRVLLLAVTSCICGVIVLALVALCVWFVVSSGTPSAICHTADGAVRTAIPETGHPDASSSSVTYVDRHGVQSLARCPRLRAAAGCTRTNDSNHARRVASSDMATARTCDCSLTACTRCPLLADMAQKNQRCVGRRWRRRGGGNKQQRARREHDACHFTYADEHENVTDEDGSDHSAGLSRPGHGAK